MSSALKSSRVFLARLLRHTDSALAAIRSLKSHKAKGSPVTANLSLPRSIMRHAISLCLLLRFPSNKSNVFLLRKSVIDIYMATFKSSAGCLISSKISNNSRVLGSHIWLPSTMPHCSLSAPPCSLNAPLLRPLALSVLPRCSPLLPRCSL